MCRRWLYNCCLVLYHAFYKKSAVWPFMCDSLASMYISAFLLKQKRKDFFRFPLETLECIAVRMPWLQFWICNQGIWTVQLRQETELGTNRAPTLNKKNNVYIYLKYCVLEFSEILNAFSTVWFRNLRSRTYGSTINDTEVTERQD